MCQLTRCCFCFSLRQGSLILGYLGLVISGLMLRRSFWYFVINSVAPSDSEDTSLKIKISAVLIFFLGYNLVGCLCLLHGIKHGKPNYMLPFLIGFTIWVVVWGGFTVLALVSTIRLSTYEPSIAYLIIFTAVNVYLYLCVLSLFKQMKSPSQEPCELAIA